MQLPAPGPSWAIDAPRLAWLAQAVKIRRDPGPPAHRGPTPVLNQAEVVPAAAGAPWPVGAAQRSSTQAALNSGGSPVAPALQRVAAVTTGLDVRPHRVVVDLHAHNPGAATDALGAEREVGLGDVALDHGHLLPVQPVGVLDARVPEEAGVAQHEAVRGPLDLLDRHGVLVRVRDVGLVDHREHQPALLVHLGDRDLALDRLVAVRRGAPLAPVLPGPDPEELLVERGAAPLFAVGAGAHFRVVHAAAEEAGVGRLPHQDGFEQPWRELVQVTEAQDPQAQPLHLLAAGGAERGDEAPADVQQARRLGGVLEPRLERPADLLGVGDVLTSPHLGDAVLEAAPLTEGHGSS